MTKTLAKALERATKTEENRLDCIAECEAINNKLLAAIDFGDLVSNEQKEIWTNSVDALVKAYVNCENSLASSYINKALAAQLKTIIEQFATVDSYVINEIAENLEIVAYLRGIEA